MKKFSQFLKEMDTGDIAGGFNDDDRDFLHRAIARLSHFSPKEVEYTKDMLLSLQKMVEDKLTGA